MCKWYSLLFFFISVTLWSQQNVVTGSVKNSDGNSIPFANIIIDKAGESSNSIGFGYSNEEGLFEITIPPDISLVSINITAIGYKEKTTSVNLEEQDFIEVVLEIDVTQLKEVVIEAQQNEDTLNLAIHNMNLNKGKTLRDLLNKTDGVIVGEEGGISYRGKQIKKVLINGKEVFINQNKIALDNLTYEIMEKVQVINNYKDKFAIDFNKVFNPVINIETKEEFKGLIKGNLTGGYGHEESYKIGGKGFFFSDKFNAFLTSNTNNVGEKELIQKEVLTSVADESSETFSRLFYPFFSEDNLAEKNFSSNNTLTLRKERENSRIGTVLYHGNMDFRRDVNYQTFLGDTLFRRSNNSEVIKGNFLSGLINYGNKTSANSVLQNKMSFVVVGQPKKQISIDTLFIPSIQPFLEKIDEDSKSVVLKNNLKFTKQVDTTSILDIKLDYLYENYSNNFNSILPNSSFTNIFYTHQFNKHYLAFGGDLSFDFKNNAAKAGVLVSRIDEDATLNYENNVVDDSDISRNIFTVELPINYNGTKNNFEYNFSIAPALVKTKNKDSRYFLKMSHLLRYNFKTQNNLSLNIRRDYTFYDLNSLLDTVVNSFNYRITNDRNNIEQLSRTNRISLDWNNNNVAKSKRINLSYKYYREEDFLQTVLDSISTNVIYYRNEVFDVKNSHLFQGGFNKGFYVGENYHRIDIGGDINLSLIEYPTIFQGSPAKASNTNFEPSVNLGFLPRNFFLTDIKNQIKWNNLIFKIDDEEVNSQSVITNTLTFEGDFRKTFLEFDFIYQHYNVEGENFDFPDCNLSIRYDFSDNLQFSLEGRSILTLFDWNNYSYTNTLSNGNTITRISTNNNLGYLIFLTTFKF